jgi:putative membrane protein
MLPPSAKAFLQRWLITTFAVLIAAHVVKGISYDNVSGLLFASLLLGVMNAFFRPIMLLITLPLLILSFGFFVLIINAILLYLVDWVVRGFHVASFWSAFWGALVISLISLMTNVLLGTGRPHIDPAQRRGPPDPPGTGGGPIIDV